MCCAALCSFTLYVKWSRQWRRQRSSCVPMRQLCSIWVSLCVVVIRPFWFSYITISIVRSRWRKGGHLEWVSLPTRCPYPELCRSLIFLNASICFSGHLWDLLSSHTLPPPRSHNPVKTVTTIKENVSVSFCFSALSVPREKNNMQIISWVNSEMEMALQELCKKGFV